MASWGAAGWHRVTVDSGSAGSFRRPKNARPRRWSVTARDRSQQPRSVATRLQAEVESCYAPAPRPSVFGGLKRPGRSSSSPRPYTPRLRLGVYVRIASDSLILAVECCKCPWLPSLALTRSCESVTQGQARRTCCLRVLSTFLLHCCSAPDAAPHTVPPTSRCCHSQLALFPVPCAPHVDPLHPVMLLLHAAPCASLRPHIALQQSSPLSAAAV
ncbi:hypothetical protein HaLaN_14631 [Haematococcus lacustris]|uniref:Uncharacterized protein n=1 Tax=Haematococcus lacustris TaxID=44745 RepID=A0A699Z5J5_HAELA|nr:hypothetical protein HaLaN_14631 [Haematococcus lacustris]